MEKMFYALRIKETKQLVRFTVDETGDHILNDNDYGIWLVNTREYAEKVASKKYAAWGEYHTPYIREEIAYYELEIVELKIVEA